MTILGPSCQGGNHWTGFEPNAYLVLKAQLGNFYVQKTCRWFCPSKFESLARWRFARASTLWDHTSHVLVISDHELNLWPLTIISNSFVTMLVPSRRIWQNPASFEHDALSWMNWMMDWITSRSSTCIICQTAISVKDKRVMLETSCVLPNSPGRN